MNLVCRLDSTGEDIEVTKQPLVPMRPDLLQLFKKDELSKYYTDEEIVDVTDEVQST